MPSNNDDQFAVGSPMADASNMTPSPCPNCDYPEAMAYCPRCGQKQIEGKPKLKQLIGDLLSDLFEADSRLLQSLKMLITKPGFLTVAYGEGRRTRYLHPFRLYLVASVTFFLIATIPTSISKFPEKFQKFRSVVNREFSDTADSAETVIDLVEVPVAKADTTADPDGGFSVTVGGQRLEFGDNEEFQRSLVQNVGTMMFVLLPIFAMFTKLLYFTKKQFYYADHLIYLLHLHSFAFLLLIPVLLIDHWVIVLGAFLWGMNYLYRSAQLFFQQSRRWTLLKIFFVMITYLVVFLTFFVLVTLMTAVNSLA